jgi:hypothetical protein
MQRYLPAVAAHGPFRPESLQFNISLLVVVVAVVVEMQQLLRGLVVAVVVLVVPLQPILGQ